MKALRILLAALMVFASANFVAAQGGITVDHVEGLNGLGQVEDGATLTFHMRLSNTDEGAAPIMALTNGYVIQSDGATWTGMSGELNPAYNWDLNFGFPCFFDLGMYVNVYDPVIGFGGAAGQFGTGLPAEFDDIGYTITVGPISQNSATELVLDSSFYGTAGYWIWGISGGIGVDCDWYGPYTYLFPVPCVEPTITTESLPDGVVNVPYLFVVESGGTEPAFSMSGAPAGLAIDPTSGEISGTPTESGAFDITVDVTNDCGSDSKLFAGVEFCAPAEITTTTLPDGVVGVAYSTTIVATGSATLSFALTLGPTGMDIDAATGELTWGTPTVGDHDVTVEVSNACGTDEQAYVLTVCEPPEITTTALPDGEVGTPYSFTVTATGTPALTFALTTSPGNMSIDENTGEITWANPSEGTHDVIVEVTNDCGTDEEAFALTICAPPEITTATLPDAVVDVAYSTTIIATGTAPLSFALTLGPTGMDIDAATGELTWGTPTVGDHDVTVEVTNACGADAQAYVLGVCQPADITSEPPLTADVGTEYTYTVVATGHPEVTYGLVSGPEGMSINSETGVLTWTPEACGDADVTVEANTDCGGEEQTFHITVNQAPFLADIPDQVQLLGGTFTYQVDATGCPDLSFSLPTAPSGMTISGTGLIEWTPTAGGFFDVTVEASNVHGTVTDDFDIQVVSDTTWMEPDPLYLKDLPEARICTFYITDQYLMNIKLATVRVNGKIPAYENDGVAWYDDDQNPTMVITSAFVFRYLSAWRPIRIEDVGYKTYFIEFQYEDGSVKQTYGQYWLGWEDPNAPSDGNSYQDDIDELTDYIFNKGNPLPVLDFEEAYDMNGDGRIDARDVNDLSRLILED
ncbi:MAG: putative Ig domain-containing protein [Candidatus Zixiibacteriota bacterium]|nr:MAG: putative Ig domain-containing protein [candidate division Zixibacteria bacterium]